MSQSNSKLTQEQKEDFKALKLGNPEVKLFSYPGSGVTIAIRRTSDTMAEFAVSIASEDEKKFKIKVGKYWAMQRFTWGQTLPCRIVLFTCLDPLEVTAVRIAGVV